MAMNSPIHRGSLPRTGRGVQRATLRRKRLHTLFIGLSFVSLGINSAIAGPTFLDIIQILNVSVEGGSALFTSGAVGYLVGSLASGFALERMNQELLLFGSMIGTGVFVIAMPWVVSLPLMALVIAVGKVFSASIDTGGNAVCLLIWGLDSGPYMHAIHFAFALGGLLGPLIAQPFLVDRSNASTTIGNWSTSTAMVKERCEDNNCIPSQSPETRVQFAFLIAGCIAVVISLTFLYMYFKYKRHVKRNRTGKEDTETKRELTTISKIVYLVLLALLSAFICGVEDSFATYLATFVVKYSRWSKYDSANITTVFWGAFALARLLSIFIAKFISPWTVILVDCLLILLSLLLLCIQTHVTGVLWTTSALIGISTASIIPSVFTWTEMNIMHVSGRIASLFVISGSVARMCNPLIVGYLFDHVTPMWLLWLLLGETIFFIFVFGVLSILVRLRYGHIFVARRSEPLDITVSGHLLEGQERSQPIVIEGSDRSSCI